MIDAGRGRARERKVGPSSIVMQPALARHTTDSPFGMAG